MQLSDGGIDERESLADDLRTVVTLLTGVRLPEPASVDLVGQVLRGAHEPLHEAVVYHLATHLLALNDRPALDSLAYTWLSHRDPTTRWTVRSAADALRLAVFAVESGWDEELLRALFVLVAQSRSTPVWVSLSDLARSGGRNAAPLERVMQLLVEDGGDDAARRAALLLLSGAHELHHYSVHVDPDGWILVANRAPDCRAATLFYDGLPIEPGLMHRVDSYCVRWQALTVLHSHPGGVCTLARYTEGQRVLSMRRTQTYPDDHKSAVVHVHGSRGAANHPTLPGMAADRVLDVFGCGAEVATDGRWWLAELGGADVMPGARGRLR